MTWSILGITLFALGADIVLKQAAVDKSSGLFGIGIALYIVDAVLWYLVYRSEKFSTVAVTYSVFTILLSVAVGIVVFREQIGVREAIGITLGVLSLFFLGRFA